MCKRVLVTLDGSHTSEAVLAEAKKLGPGAEVTLLMVGSQPKATSEAPRPPYTGGAPAPGGVVAMPPPRTVESRAQAYDRGRDEMMSYLESCAKPLRDAGFDVRLEVRFGDPVEEILSAAKDADADVIMMATHGHSALVQVVFGSVASRVVGSGVRPVLLVRPRELRSQKS